MRMDNGTGKEDRVNRILKHPVFLNKLNELYEMERERLFCRHGMEHLLDVARLSMILSGEVGEHGAGGPAGENHEHGAGNCCGDENEGGAGNCCGEGDEGVAGRPSREILYGAALLHDIGRGRQYLDGTPHEQEGRRLALPILLDCGYTLQEAERIAGAIGMHRRRESAFGQGLAGVLYRADKMSRSCFACRMEKECDWKEGRKNRRLVY